MSSEEEAVKTAREVCVTRNDVGGVGCLEDGRRPRRDLLSAQRSGRRPQDGKAAREAAHPPTLPEHGRSGVVHAAPLAGSHAKNATPRPQAPREVSRRREWAERRGDVRTVTGLAEI